jgi:hypothetical protein
MSPTSPDDVLAALREFTTRIDALDPAASPCADVEVRVGDRSLRLPLREPVARALVEALRSYHDPRDHGGCDHCGGRRVDANLICLDCGRPNGLFGQLLAERAARYAESPPIESAPSRA